MADTINFNMRIDGDTKKPLEQPNRETIAALLEAERIARDPSLKGCSDAEEVLKALKEQ